MLKKIGLLSAFLTLAACNTSLQQIFTGEALPVYNAEVENAALKTPRSIIVCRSKQCAPSNLSMSREYIYNSLLHLLGNNNHKTAMICEADALSHTCTENYLTMPIKVGITPANMFIDSVKITDVMVAKGNTQFNLVLNYNVSYNGQTPDCLPARTLLYVKNVSNIIMEDSGYTCKMNTIGQTSIKTVFAVDYIDLDYGFIGGYYSIGASGPSYGGGTGYMMIRLPKDAYPLSPALTSPKSTPKKSVIGSYFESPKTEAPQQENTNVQVFPVGR